MCDGGGHVYLGPKIPEQLFYACINHHCTHMTQYDKELAEKAPIASVESFEYLFKCAAQLLFDFVDQ